MKKLIALGLVLGSVGFGRSVMPQVRVAEAVRVTNVEQYINLKPPMAPSDSGRITTVLTLDVMSNGCTHENDFRVDVQTRGKQQTLKVVRTSPDLCEATPHVKTLQIPAEGIRAEAELYISNPVLIDVRKVY